METTEKYLAALEVLVDESVFEYNKVYQTDKHNISTNRYCIVATPRFGEYDTKPHGFSVFYDIKEHLAKPIDIIPIADALGKLELIDVFEEDEVECDACDGTGVVDFDFYYGSKSYEVEADCPVCNGGGVIYKKSDKPPTKEFKGSQYIKIGDMSFYPERVNELVAVAQIIGEDVLVVNQERYSTMFKIGDDVYFLMMKVRSCKPEEIAYTFEL
jgi:hypothetical protein